MNTDNKLRSSLRSPLLVAVGLLVGAHAACWGQSSVGGGMAGTVVDSSGAAIRQAKITIRNEETSRPQTIVADDNGFFRATALDPGSYTVLVQASGFGDFSANHVVVAVGRVSEVNPKLSPGTTSASVTVVAEVNALNTDAPDFAANFNQKDIEDLPINGRHWTSFALLSPGVTLGDSKFGLVSFRGMSNLQNNFTVDGADDNQAFQSVERGYTRVGYSTSQEAIEEFQVNTSNYSAQYGRSAGGGVNAVTKSGTNTFHGSGFWYDRDNQFGATNSFTTLNGSPIKPKDKRQQRGGSIGGPILKNRLFFFYAFDQQVRLFPIVATPTAGFLAAETAQGAVAQARGIPAADVAGAWSYLASLTGLIPRKGNQTINFPKVDWKVNEKNSLSVAYNHLDWNSPGGIQTNPVIQRGITSSGNDYVKIDSVIANLNTTLKPNLINTFRFEFARDYEYETNQTPLASEPTTGPGGLPPESYINTQGGFFIGTPDYLPRSSYPNEHENQSQDTISWVKSGHTITAGFDFRRVNDDIAFLNPLEGEFTFSGTNALADFVTDYSNYAYHTKAGCDSAHDALAGTLPCYSTIQQQFGKPEFQFATSEYAAFVQDDWKIRPNLTLNLGLRYELEKLPAAQIANPAIAGTQSFPTSKLGFGPRVGWAWTPFHDSKTVVRGGYGVYYGRVQNGTIFQALSATGSSAGQFNYTVNGTSPTAPVYPNVLSGGSFAASNVKVFDAGFKVPKILQGDFIIQRTLPWNTVVSASYLLSQGRHLPNFIDENIAPSTTTKTYSFVGGPLAGQTYTTPFFTTRLNPAYAQITHIVSNVDSNYNALVLQVDHRFSYGVQFQASYTWSKALDYGMNETQGADGNDPYDPFNQRLDYGKSVDNIPQRFVGSLIWSPTVKTGNRVADLVLNQWSIAPIATLQSGIAYSYIVSGGAPGGILSTLNGSGGANYLNVPGRNSRRQPAIQDVDLRISRSFVFRDKYRLEALVESFNLFNRLNVTGVNTTAYTASGTTLTYQSTFGATTAAGNTIYRERQVQFSARFRF